MKTTLLLLAALLFAQTSLSAPHPSLPPVGSLDGLGVNIHFTDPKPGELEMIAAAGFKWVRMDLTWAATECQRGEYDFSAYDRLVAALERNKLHAVFILDYGNPLYAEPGDKHPFTSRAGTPEFREAFAKWAVAAVSRYAGKGYLWELWNEPNHAGFWKPKPNAADYIALAKTACEALRVETNRRGTEAQRQEQSDSSSAPQRLSGSNTFGEAIIGPATSTIDLPFLEECFKAGLLEHWAAVSVHPYRQTAPETVEEEYRSLRLLIRKYLPKGREHGDIPILSGEWGYSTAYPAFKGKTAAEAEEMQAKWLARMFLTNIANDIPLSIWYDWRDDGDDPKEAEHRFGIVRRAYREGKDPVFEPKPAYQAAKTLMGELKGMRFNKLVGFSAEELHDGSYQYLFEKNDAVALAGYAFPTDQETLRLPDCRAKVTDLLGKESGRTVVVNRDERLRFRQSPQVITFPDADLIWKAIASWNRLPLEIVLEPDKRPSPIPLRILNPFAQPFDITALTWSGAITAKVGSGNLGDVLHPNQEYRAEFENRFATRLPRASRLEMILHLHADRSDPDIVFQSVPVVATHPIDFEVLPPREKRIPVLVKNPTGRPFAGSVGMFVIEWSTDDDIPLRLEAGEREKLIEVPPANPKHNDPILIALTPSVDDDAIGIDGVRLPQQTLLDTELLKEAVPRVDGAEPRDAVIAIKLEDPLNGRSLSNLPSVRLNYAFPAGWRFVQLHSVGAKSWDPSNQPERFALWLHGDGKGCQARIRFIDSTGQTFQADGPQIDWQGWRYVTFPMQSTDEKPLTHWGGANDGKIHYPIKWDTIFLLDNVSREPVEGEIYLSAPTLIY